MTLSDFGMPNSKIKKTLTRFKPIFKIPNPQLNYFSSASQGILFLLALFLVFLLYFKFYYPSPLPPEEDYKEIVVEVLGDVQKPGVHIFKHPPTLREAIEKAGGIKNQTISEKDLSLGTLETGSLLTVQKVSSQETKIKIERMEAKKLMVFSIPLDLNRVSVEDLCLIPGIGESLAQEIITYRRKRGRFRSVEELKNVKGIGEKNYQFLKIYFTVRGNP